MAGIIEGVTAGELPLAANAIPPTAPMFHGAADSATAASAKLWAGRSLAAGDGLAYKFVPGVGLYLKNGATADGAVNAAGIAAGKGLAVTPFGASGTTPLYPNAAAVAAGLAYPTTTLVGAVPLLDNGATLDPQEGNRSYTLLASAARTATTTTATQTNRNARGVLIQLQVTANPGGAETLQPRLYTTDGTNIYQYCAGTASALGGTAGTFQFLIYPGALQADIVASGGAIANDVKGLAVPRLWQLRIIHSASGSWTYAAFANLIS